jgi:uncharacterized Zn-finger protein
MIIMNLSSTLMDRHQEMLNKPAPQPVPKNETITVDNHADQVACDGGGGPLGHPLVYYTFDSKDIVECLYCDRTFIKTRARHIS